MKKQDFKVLKTKDLYPFPDNPFHVAEDETLSELAESIKEFVYGNEKRKGRTSVREKLKRFRDAVSQNIEL